MTDMMELNLNTQVEVDLTPEGERIWVGHWDAIGAGDWAKKKIQDGVLKEQIWTLMRIFGPYMLMGRPNVMDMTIRVPADRLSPKNK